MDHSSVQTKAEARAWSLAAFEQAGIAADEQMLREAAAALMRLAPRITQDPSQPALPPEGKPA
jgi:hypothetical protein